MQLDTFFPPYTKLKEIPEMSKAAEALGFNAVWMAETQHDPFLPCALVAEHTQRIQFGTAIAVGFARSPGAMAYTAWDLAEASDGRFILGLGTQVKAHIERRFGMEWPASPVAKQREQIEALRAIWQAWQEGERLNYRGDYYKLTLMTPFFTPAAMKYANIPVYIAGVNKALAGLAGEMADGFHVHPYHSAQYLKTTMLPAIEGGLAKGGRKRDEISIAVNVFTVTNETERALARQQISFYASTPSYRGVMALHGWEEAGEQLSALASRKEWAEMPDLISDEMLETFAVIAGEADLGAALRERYGGLADRITIYTPFVPGERDHFWRQIIGEFQEA
jgi:probable F420-dependent oxidoreductase